MTYFYLNRLKNKTELIQASPDMFYILTFRDVMCAMANYNRHSNEFYLSRRWKHIHGGTEKYSVCLHELARHYSRPCS